MSSEPDLLTTLKECWFRFSTLGVVSLVFVELLQLTQGELRGWTFYLKTGDVVFEVVVRVIASALAGIALGTACTALLLPFLWLFGNSRRRVSDWASNAAIVFVLLVVGRHALQILNKMFYSGLRHRPHLEFLVFTIFYGSIALALILPRKRPQLFGTLDLFVNPKAARHIVAGMLIGTAVLVGTEFVLSKMKPPEVVAATPQHAKSNIILITFDALSAEDMSMYGRELPTTPNIDAFAREATVFTNFYSASTFTTPSVATLLTGRYATETLVYQISGQVRADEAEKNLPAVLRAAGYSTGAYVFSPIAFYLARSLQSAFDFMPEPEFQAGGMARVWRLTAPLHQDSGIGCRVDEYWDLERVYNKIGGGPVTLCNRYRPNMSFEQAKELLQRMPEGSFLWIHIMSPHDPYFPDPVDLGRFLPASALPDLGWEPSRLWKPRYDPDVQSQVTERRLRYDEFVATADRYFGDFLTYLSSSGKLDNSTVIVSADHGESFEGGVYQHENFYMTRPVVHIPLIIRSPGQQQGRTVELTADQTALPPTILEIAGVSKPDWMHGESLVPVLNGTAPTTNGGLAFSEHLEETSIFKRPRKGTVGVIDEKYQYVVYLETQKGALRPLKEAQLRDLDLSAQYPDRAAAMRNTLQAKFPQLVRKQQ